MRVERVGVVLAGGLATVLAVASLAVGTATASNGWSSIALDHGRTGAYLWSAGALTRSTGDTDKLCATLTIGEAAPSDGVSLGQDSTECGVLTRADRPVTGSISSGSGASRVEVLERLYEPSVRRAVVLFGDGTRNVHRLRAGAREAHGTPRFRYLVLPLLASACVRGVTTFGAAGRLIAHEAGRGCGG